MQLLKIKENNCTELKNYLIRVSFEMEKEIKRYSCGRLENNAEYMRKVRLAVTDAISNLQQMEYQNYLLKKDPTKFMDDNILS